MVVKKIFVFLHLKDNYKRQIIMITKDTPAYAKAQNIANELSAAASTGRHNRSAFDRNFEIVVKFIRKITVLNCFAAEVAKTILNTCNPIGYTVARISSKQAWIIACAAVENDVEL